MRFLAVPCLLGLVLFYAAVAWLAAHPEVSSGYAAYYIDRTSGLSPVEQARLQAVVPGRTYRHRDQTIGFAWWSAPESAHRWSDGRKAQIVFRLVATHPPAAPRCAVVKVRTAGRQRVSWQLNNGQWHEDVLEGDLAWRLPLAGRDIAAGTNTLTFHFHNARRPGGDDLRELALALESVRFE